MAVQIPSSFANAVAPFTLMGRQPVGQENPDLKISTLKPLEQSAESARSENRRSPEERPNEVDERARLQEGRGRRQSQEDDRDKEKQQEQQEAERHIILELAARDREVRAHEQAHAAVGGQHASSPVYEYVRGPDGVSYAVAGEVSISTSPVAGDPEATIIKAQQIRRAANAPADPSPQDRRVAAEATRLETEARAELQQQKALEEVLRAEQEEAAQAKKAQLEEESRNAQEKRDQRAEQRAAEQGRGEHAGQWLVEQRRDAVDLQRRLSDIGAIERGAAVGRFFDKNV